MSKRPLDPNNPVDRAIQRLRYHREIARTIIKPGDERTERQGEGRRPAALRLPDDPYALTPEEQAQEADRRARIRVQG